MASQRAVTFIDVLGFREKLSTLPLDTLAANYESAIAMIRGLNRPLVSSSGMPSLFPTAKPEDRWCIQHVFSDSIMLFALDESDESFLKLVVYSWRVVQALLATGMHPRGAIAFGEMHVNETANIFLGKALAEAYELEQIQDWVGVALAPSACARYAEIVDEVASPKNGQPSFLVRQMVLLKRTEQSFLGRILKLFPFTRYKKQSLVVINWRWNLVAKYGSRSLLPQSSVPSVRQKTANTVEYLERIVASGALYPIQQEQVPVELRTFYIGDTEPPFPHGDAL
ncbi:hypothetical protein Q9Q94_02180 [Uliginosibacterium sp. 31-16]|uniref:hypothetical protein n=1 Tax=Uliginosibacterium sp. 31-16 TaxID=3068315 RepID=UPI00273E2D25|nr:hypothetical protein [Uliginosibacterium sp. 31-16]MDP5238314.1 hypothetical protein [Uliginosibacterium sp. 31-16]